MSENNVNKTNLEVYDSLLVEELQNLAKIGGLEDGCDIKLIKSFLLKASSILEVGAGYGRALTHILNLGFTGKITAVEHSKIFCDELRRRFSERVNIINDDLLNINFTERYDCVLWLWNGISDFPKTEQAVMLQKLLNLLLPGGVLIFDTFPLVAIPINGTKISEQEFKINFNLKVLTVYCPTIDEVNHYGDQLQIQKRQHIDYETDIGRKRIMHIFYNPSTN